MRTLYALLLAAILPTAWAAPVEINNVRIWSAPDYTRLVFDVSAPVVHRLSPVEDRVEVYIEAAHLLNVLPAFDAKKSFLTKLASQPFDKGVLVSIDLKKDIQANSFVLKPYQRYGHRLVVDLSRAKPAEPAKATPVVEPLITESTVSAPPLRDLVIAIDAGHGGDDPGAIGSTGAYEKDVVLAIARKLAAIVNKEPGMRAVLIRDGDYYVSLRQRIKKARQEKADLFISIHADAFYKSAARGSSVYTLSPRGASSEAARWLANKENAADLVGGVSLEDKDELLASVLLDLSQSASIEASRDVGAIVLTRLKGLGSLHKSSVQQAGFAVLKSPDIPSILVETAFISNPSEEKKLKSARHQHALAEAIMSGVRAYFAKYNLPQTVLAQDAAPAIQKHRIRRGDTLLGIAKKYRISTAVLRSANAGLSSDVIKVGEILSVPVAADQDS